MSAGPIRGEDGAIHGAIASYEDVTHFTEIERLREEWTPLVAHDLKQPLSAISAYAGMLSRLPESAGVTAWSQKILVERPRASIGWPKTCSTPPRSRRGISPSSGSRRTCAPCSTRPSSSQPLRGRIARSC